MPFNFASAKASARRAVHTTLGVPAWYTDDSLSAPIETRARWHNRIDRFGDDENQRYAEVVEGVERIVLIPEVWETEDGVSTNTGVPFTPRRGGTLTFPDYESVVFRLDVHEPVDGPLEQAWLAVRE